MRSHLSPYGEKMNPARPLPEYPRPQMARDSYLNLNGYWRYAFTQDGGPPTCWQGEIVVPFSPECTLSGVQRVLQPDETLWYERELTIPADFICARTLLHFGGVDQTCTVFLNGQELGSHTGGYLPFSFEITQSVHTGQNILRLKVTDPSENGSSMRGYQSLQGKAGSRPAMSGIWQTVWMESLPETFIAQLRIRPLYDEQAVEITVLAEGPEQVGEVTVLALASQVVQRRFTVGEPLRLPLPGALSWHPRNPFLYTVRFCLGQDTVNSYFGMRKFSLETQGGRPRFFLNNHPYLLQGVLDEGFYPDGFYTPPTEAAIKDDLRYAKRCGFNFIRKYGKAEPLRWYHHCDKLGLLVWQDLPGSGLQPGETVWNKWWYRTRKDTRYRAFGREDPAQRQVFLLEAEALAQHLYNIPSLCAYTLFSEGYGQFDSAGLALQFSQRDPTRLIDHASGWFDQGGGQVRSLHCLDGPPASLGPVDARMLAISACGGGAEPPAREAVAQLWADMATLVPEGLSAFCYYRLAAYSAQEGGLLSADRRTQNIPPDFLSPLSLRLASVPDRTK